MRVQFELYKVEMFSFVNTKLTMMKTASKFPFLSIEVYHLKKKYAFELKIILCCTMAGLNIFF